MQFYSVRGRPRAGGRLRTVIAVALAPWWAPSLGCGAPRAEFPPQPPQAAIPEARGLRILLEEDGHENSGPFGDALQRALSEVGFSVERHVPGMPPSKVYDFGLRYRSTPVLGEWRIGLAEAVAGGLHWNWKSRYSATRYFQSGDPAVFGSMAACYADWKSRVVASGLYDEPKPGTLRFVASSLVSINGPTLKPDQELAPETHARAASILVGLLTQCSGFTKALEVMHKSGVASSDAMDQLPTEALRSVCWSSTDDDGELAVHGTGLVERLEDACKVMVRRDPKLAAEAEQVDQAREARRRNDREWLATHPPPREPASDGADSSSGRGAGPSGAGSSAIDPATGKLIVQGAEGIIHDIEQAEQHGHHGKPKEGEKGHEKK
jgi:hypothetical protein